MKFLSHSYGILLSIGIALVAIIIAPYLPIGAVVVAIILGIIIGNVFELGEFFSKGIKFCESQILAWAIALMGVNLDFLVLKEIGTKSIMLVIVAMFITILSGIIIGKVLKLNSKFSLLLGIGNAVCGSSAIAAY